MNSTINSDRSTVGETRPQGLPATQSAPQNLRGGLVLAALCALCVAPGCKSTSLGWLGWSNNNADAEYASSLASPSETAEPSSIDTAALEEFDPSSTDDAPSERANPVNSVATADGVQSGRYSPTMPGGSPESNYPPESASTSWNNSPTRTADARDAAPYDYQGDRYQGDSQGYGNASPASYDQMNNPGNPAQSASNSGGYGAMPAEGRNYSTGRYNTGQVEEESPANYGKSAPYGGNASTPGTTHCAPETDCPPADNPGGEFGGGGSYGASAGYGPASGASNPYTPNSAAEGSSPYSAAPSGYEPSGQYNAGQSNVGQSGAVWDNGTGASGSWNQNSASESDYTPPRGDADFAADANSASSGYSPGSTGRGGNLSQYSKGGGYTPNAESRYAYPATSTPDSYRR